MFEEKAIERVVEVVEVVFAKTQATFTNRIYVTRHYYGDYAVDDTTNALIYFALYVIIPLGWFVDVDFHENLIA